MNRAAIALLAAAHLGVAAWHGRAHASLAIELPVAKTVFVAVVIFVAPLAAASLTWTRHVRIGAWVFTLSMFGALVFGVYHHFVLASPDNVAYLPPGGAVARSTFVMTAGGLALLELASTLYGVFCLRSLYGAARANPTPGG
jgi:hypothetical protein